MKTMQKSILLIFLLFSLFIFTVSCSQSSPEIRSSLIQLIQVELPSKLFVERLSLYVYFDDSDGPSDFGSISLSHNDTGLVWNILGENCSVRLRGKDRWSGSSDLAGPGNKEIPSGLYTLTVTDLAGNEAISVINLVKPEFPKTKPVSFSLKDGKWEIIRNDLNSSFSRTFLLLFDKDSKLIFSLLVPFENRNSVEGTMQSLESLASGMVSVQCYTENESGTAGFLLTPVNIK